MDNIIFIKGTIEIQPGIYTYTFQCNLPDNLPTSLESQNGYIRYSVLVKLDRPLMIDTEFLQPFTVIKKVNLNDSPALRVGILIFCIIFTVLIHIRVFFLSLFYLESCYEI